MKIYAKQCDPELFDYRIYEGNVSEDIIVEGNRDYPGFNDGDLKAIKEFINNYNCYDYEVYYDGKIKDYAYDYLPQKDNGKHLSPSELHQLKQSLDDMDDEETILLCLSIIKGKKYRTACIRGYCQGEWCKVYCPVDTTDKEIDYLEAIYFATGVEIEIDDSDKEDIQNEDEIEGFTYLSTKWNADDIKEEIASLFKDVSPDDVVLYMIERTYTKRVNVYEKH